MKFKKVAWVELCETRVYVALRSGYVSGNTFESDRPPSELSVRAKVADAGHHGADKRG
jgi:hypothetical protein